MKTYYWIFYNLNYVFKLILVLFKLIYIILRMFIQKIGVVQVTQLDPNKL